MKLLYKKMGNKKGISGVITVVIMVALVMVVAAIVWVVVRNIVQGELGGVESCFGAYDKVKIESMYTCYDSDSNNFQFSINVKDIDASGVLVSIAGEGATKSYTITNQAQTIENLANYSSGVFGTDLIKLPGKNGGLTYLENTFTAKPDLMQIAPIIDGKQCDASDSLSEIDDCASLT